MVHGAYRFKEMQGKNIESRTRVKRTNPRAERINGITNDDSN